MHWTLVVICALSCASGAVPGNALSQDTCSAYGDYELAASRGVIQLRANESATCLHTCPESRRTLPQIECLGGDPSSCSGANQISSATCIYQDVFTMKYYSCVFLNATGHVMPVARYSFELEYESTDSNCVLRNSYRVWYNQDFVRQKALLVIFGISLGCAALVFLILITLCFFYCCRRKRLDEPLLDHSDMSRAIY